MIDFLEDSLFHSTKGRYFSDTKVVGLDFISNLFRSGDSTSTLIHETVHTFLCNNTEMGIVFADVEKNAHNFKHLDTDQQKRIVQLIFDSQQMLQEGYSTFMQFAMLKRKLSRQEQDEWLKRVPSNYRKWLRPFLFSFSLPLERREKINLLVTLAMNTHIRRDMEKYVMLDDIDKLEQYLSKESNNPSARVIRMLKTVKKDPRLLDGDLKNIPKLSGIDFFPPIEKKDIVSFINYIGLKIGITEKITEEQIGEPLSVDQIFNHVQNNTIVANLNLNLDKNSEILYSVDEVIHCSDIIERVHAIFNDEKTRTSIKAFIKLANKSLDGEPEVTLILQTKTGEKYLYTSSASKVTELLNDQLVSVVLGVKLGDYNLIDDKVYWLPQARSPDLVIFNHHWQVASYLSEYMKVEKAPRFGYCHVAFGSNFLNMLLVKVENRTPLLTVNVVIPSQVSEILEVIKPYSTEYSDSFLGEHKRQLNSHLILWTGFDHRIDWANVLIEEGERPA